MFYSYVLNEWFNKIKSAFHHDYFHCSCYGVVFLYNYHMKSTFLIQLFNLELEILFHSFNIQCWRMKTFSMAPCMTMQQLSSPNHLKPRRLLGVHSLQNKHISLCSYQVAHSEIGFHCHHLLTHSLGENLLLSAQLVCYESVSQFFFQSWTLARTNMTFTQTFAQSVWNLTRLSFHEHRRYPRASVSLSFFFFTPTFSPNLRLHPRCGCLVILSWWSNDWTINENISICSGEYTLNYLSCAIF